ncbi:hypothetical protein [Streptomyces sp. NPDC051776]|uniref:hypothetical protein n=1 Tax=Streptomyces sp. NPDC051776 TaxID=3155414 RepID=UPI0034495924
MRYGQTIMAAHAALRIARSGRVLVLLPTQDLLTQTVEAWRREAAYRIIGGGLFSERSPGYGQTTRRIPP